MRMTSAGVLTGYEQICAGIHGGEACKNHSDLIVRHPVYVVAYNQRLTDIKSGVEIHGAHTLHG